MMGGLNQSAAVWDSDRADWYSTDLLKDNEFTRLDNTYVDNLGELKKRLGYSKLNTTEPTEASADGIRGLHRYYHNYEGTITGTFLGAYGKNLYTWAATPVKITHADTTKGTAGNESFTVSKDWSFVTFRNSVFGTNGTEDVIRYGPTDALGTIASLYLRDAGCLNPGSGSATFTEQGSGAGPSVGYWWYKHSLVYDGGSESTADWLKGSAYQSVNGYSNAITGITASTEPGAIDRRVYRAKFAGPLSTDVQLTPWRLVKVVDSVAATSMTDDVDDDLLGEEYQGDNIFRDSTNYHLTDVKYVTVYANRLFLAYVRVTDRPEANRLYYSEDGIPETVRGASWIDIDRDGGDEIVQIAVVNESLAVFKRNSVWVLEGTNPSTWELRQVIKGVGLSSLRGIREVLDTLVFASRDGLYEFDGIRVSPLPANVNESVRSVDRGSGHQDDQYIALGYADKHLYASLNDHNRGQNDYSSHHGACFMKNIEMGGWNRWLNSGTAEGLEWGVFCTWDGQPDQNEVYVGASDDGYVYRIENTAYDDQPANNDLHIPVNIQTKSWGFGDPETDKVFRRVWVHCRISPGFPVYLNFRVDNGLWLPVHMHVIPVAADKSYPEYAVARFILPPHGDQSRGKMLSLWIADNTKNWVAGTATEVLPTDFRVYGVIVEFRRKHEE